MYIYLYLYTHICVCVYVYLLEMKLQCHYQSKMADGKVSEAFLSLHVSAVAFKLVVKLADDSRMQRRHFWIVNSECFVYESKRNVVFLPMLEVFICSNAILKALLPQQKRWSCQLCACTYTHTTCIDILYISVDIRGYICKYLLRCYKCRSFYFLQNHIAIASCN